MRSLLSMARLLLFALCAAAPAMSQAPGGVDQSTPESLKAAYDNAMQGRDWSEAVAAARKLVTLNASADNLLLLANAQFNSDTPQNAVATYDRILAIVQQNKPPQGQPATQFQELVGKLEISKGNVYVKLRRNSDAIAEFNKAAEIAPNPGLAYFNICAVHFNEGDVDGAASACRKSVQANPAGADAWFVLGSVLYADAKLDDHGKMTITTECRQALDKYRELAPNGPHAADVKEMLDMVGK